MDLSEIDCDVQIKKQKLTKSIPKNRSGHIVEANN